MFSLLGLHEFLPSQQLVAALEGALCAVQPALCVSFLAALCGYNPDNINSTRLPLYLSYTPAGTSVQNMAHWAQARVYAWVWMSGWMWGSTKEGEDWACL